MELFNKCSVSRPDLAMSVSDFAPFSLVCIKSDGLWVWVIGEMFFMAAQRGLLGTNCNFPFRKADNRLGAIPTPPITIR